MSFKYDIPCVATTKSGAEVPLSLRAARTFRDKAIGIWAQVDREVLRNDLRERQVPSHPVHAHPCRCVLDRPFRPLESILARRLARCLGCPLAHPLRTARGSRGHRGRTRYVHRVRPTSLDQETRLMRIDAERLVHGACTVLALLLSMAIIAMIPAIRSAGTLDTDGWFLLASGREVVESGIPTTNPFTAVEGQGIVLQQWYHDAWLFLCWKVAGYTGVAVSRGDSRRAGTVYLYRRRLPAGASPALPMGAAADRRARVFPHGLISIHPSVNLDGGAAVRHHIHLPGMATRRRPAVPSGASDRVAILREPAGRALAPAVGRRRMLPAPPKRARYRHRRPPRRFAHGGVPGCPCSRRLSAWPRNRL